MDFESWLVQTGRSTGTENKYSRAISGVISSWENEAPLCSKFLEDVSATFTLY